MGNGPPGDRSAPSVRRRVLVLTFDPLGATMPGPAIRAWHLAEVLARHHDVTLASTAGADRVHAGIDVRTATGAEVDTLVGRSDVIFAPTSVIRRHPSVGSSDRPVCIDMYIPTHLENLEPFGSAGTEEHRRAVAHQVSVIGDDLARGDFFLCASERQRDFWIGSLASAGRVNPDTYGQDPTLRGLIDVVPFGIPDEAPVHGPGGMAKVFPGIGPSDPVIIWAGGVYNWFDPLSLVEAIDELRRSIPDLRLVFLGMRNPNPAIPEMRVASELRALSDARGLTDVHVFFNEGWVPYDERVDFLLDAAVGVSTHLDHLETRYSFRTRVLDYLWAGLPTVLTEGDTLSEAIDGAGIGRAVPPGDPAAIASALSDLIASPPDAETVRAFGRHYRWSAVAGPLLRFCSSPGRAPDLATRRPEPGPPPDTGPPLRPVGEVLRDEARRVGAGLARRIRARPPR